MKLGKRLKTIADLVPENSHIIDVGCDHAFLDIYLIEKHIGISAIASDVASGPLEQAKKNIAAHHLENVIKLKQGNGIETIEEDTDTIIISGMGGRTMFGIFKNNLNKLHQIDTIIVSPNSDVILLRTFLSQHGFQIIDELMIEEKKIIYPILVFQKGKTKYSKEQLYFGPCLLETKSELFISYFKKELQRKKITLELLPKHYIIKRYRLQKEIKMIEKVIL